jgi:hypothetical protein
MEGNGQKQPAPSTTLVLSITFDQLTGQVNVSGPIENYLVCYGMLEAAKDAIRAFAVQRAQNQVITPATFLPQLKRN